MIHPKLLRAPKILRLLEIMGEMTILAAKIRPQEKAHVGIHGTHEDLDIVIIMGSDLHQNLRFVALPVREVKAAREVREEIQVT
jgi:fructose-specific component phosphotransferase system IIB-like protein